MQVFIQSAPALPKLSARLVLAPLLIMMSLLLSACGSRPETGFLAPVSQSEPGATAHTILVATTRQRDARPGTLFNGERATPLDFVRVPTMVDRDSD